MQVLILNYLGPDKAAFDVEVDLSGGSLGVGSLVDGPGADFIFTNGKEGDEF